MNTVVILKLCVLPLFPTVLLLSSMRCGFYSGFLPSLASIPFTPAHRRRQYGRMFTNRVASFSSRSVVKTIESQFRPISRLRCIPVELPPATTQDAIRWQLRSSARLDVRFRCFFPYSPGMLLSSLLLGVGITQARISQSFVNGGTKQRNVRPATEGRVQRTPSERHGN